MSVEVTTRSDEDIKLDVTKQLKWDARIDASDVSITVDNGKVMISGQVPSLTAKSAATNDAYLVEGVSIVENELNIEFPDTETVPTDEQIKNNVVTALALDGDLKSYKIDVDVKQGWVTLEGTVNAYWEKIHAKNEVLELNGVIGVTNNLGVVPTGDYMDESIAKDIVSALERNVNIFADDVNIRVENGNVTLEGTVETSKAKNAAFDSALYTPGVVSVDNKIMVV
ncbi:BON domain-containing protein [Fodinibius saliphilus]|uniref:BON domain-containing protein n=1 Tax=Fodinibius saliphilus TaxID=1920650 RepID=UPI0011086295|nr:BON domain-containing protein [Fodinibius saliphilus]